MRRDDIILCGLALNPGTIVPLRDIQKKKTMGYGNQGWNNPHIPHDLEEMEGFLPRFWRTYTLLTLYL